jgi:PAS domain S-box-containing protein
MRLLYFMSIKRKQMLVIMLTSTAALLLASAIFVGEDVISFRKGIVKNVSVLAEAIGNNCSATIEYNDPNTAAEILGALRAEHNIVAAGVYTGKGGLFASYTRAGAAPFTLPPAPATGSRFKGGFLYHFNPITQRGENIGTIFVVSDLSDLKERLGRYPAILGSMFAAAMLVAFILSNRLQRVVTNPILHLACVAQSVAKEKNYSVRAKKQSGDELGQLIDGFNEMLAQIQARDAALLAAQNTLENRVQKRTEELRQSQALYHSLVEHLPVHVYRMDQAGRFEFINSDFCRLLGKTTGQILGKTAVEISDNKDWAERFAREDQDIMQTGESIEMEEEYLDQTGKVKFFQVVKSPVFSSDGKVAGTQGMLLDVTERKQTAAKLEQAHRELVTTARQAGMAEVATSVLHNVGNVLNSVNISASVIFDAVRTSKTGDVARTVALMQEHPEDLGEFITRDARGRQIPKYLAALSEHLALEQGSILKEATALRQHIEHIKNIVAMQQSYAKVAGMTELVKITELVEDALRLNAGSLDRHGVQLVCDYDPQLPDITLDKHKVLQILVNLIRNAQRACGESGSEEKLLTVAIRNGVSGLKISVSDNGIGIPAENLTRVFNHGFTTKTDGHGFGLHSGALAADEMGGTLLAHSDGPGKGATFTLTLPLQPKTHGKD